jgi:NAD(P)-dependent dehydrogenase (short-subunit alcohol dehydrogenase family)
MGDGAGLLAGKVAVVSGVGPGLGREIVAALLRDGAAGVVLGARNEERLAAIAGELDPTGGRVAWRRCDVNDSADAEALCALAVERFGGLDALVNSAAREDVIGGLEGSDWDDWHSVLTTNVVGSMRVTSAAVPHLRARGGGSIVFIGSQSAMWPQLLQTAYAASKGALLSAVVHLAKELGPSRIRVNTVVPSWMWGPPVEGYLRSVADSQGVPLEDIVGGITVNMPLGEIPQDDDVADVVSFFCSDRSRMVSGQSLLVNAGEYVHCP